MFTVINDFLCYSSLLDTNSEAFILFTQKAIVSGNIASAISLLLNIQIGVNNMNTQVVRLLAKFFSYEYSHYNLWLLNMEI